MSGSTVQWPIPQFAYFRTLFELRTTVSDKRKKIECRNFLKGIDFISSASDAFSKAVYHIGEKKIEPVLVYQTCPFNQYSNDKSLNSQVKVEIIFEKLIIQKHWILNGFDLIKLKDNFFHISESLWTNRNLEKKFGQTLTFNYHIFQRQYWFYVFCFFFVLVILVYIFDAIFPGNVIRPI